MKVSDIMRTTPVTIEGADSLGEATQRMHQHAIRHLPVMREGRLIGVLSERDVLAFRAARGFVENWEHAHVSAAMTISPQTAGPMDSLTEVAARFAYAHIGCLPILERGALVGIITVSDVLAGEVEAAMAPTQPGSAVPS